MRSVGRPEEIASGGRGRHDYGARDGGLKLYICICMYMYCTSCVEST